MAMRVVELLVCVLALCATVFAMPSAHVDMRLSSGLHAADSSPLDALPASGPTGIVAVAAPKEPGFRGPRPHPARLAADLVAAWDANGGVSAHTPWPPPSPRDRIDTWRSVTATRAPPTA
jgi:hypothetical protein